MERNVSDDKPKYDLPLPEAILELEGQLRQMRAHPNRNQLTDLTPDEAFEKGYEVAIFDLKHYTGPNPRKQ
jgi:hypothetical protein